MNVKFNNLEELMNFIMNTKEFFEWEVCKLSIFTSLNETLNIDINQKSILNSFVEFQNVKDQIKYFYDSNKHLSLIIDIKLKVPYYLKNSIDVNNECKDFYLDFYSEGNLNIMIPTFTEKNKIFNTDAAKNWVIYSLNIYQEWFNKKQLNK